MACCKLRAVVEIWLALGFLALAAATVVLAFLPKGCSQRERAHHELRTLAFALRLYEGRYGKPVEAATGLLALVQAGIVEHGLKDPWGTSYALSEDSGCRSIKSFGPDSKPGGEDDLALCVPAAKSVPP